MSGNSNSFDSFVFGQRGLLLAVPAVALAILGKPSAFSIAVGLPLAFAGEAVRAWAVGFSGGTTRSDTVEAPALVTAGPYAYVRNPLYVGNFVTATGFAVAFTGANRPRARMAIAGAALATMLAIYAVIVPYEERFLRDEFGDAYDAYAASVPRVFPAVEPAANQIGSYDPSVIGKAESRTFVTLGAMLAVLALKAVQA